MRASETTRLFAVSFVFAVALSGCGVDGLTDTPDPLSKPDVGATPDTHESGPSDAAGVLKAVDWPDSARRGPVLLTIELTDPDDRVTGVKVEHEADGKWAPITARWNERQENKLRWAWDSFADVSVDGPVNLRFVASGLEGGDVALELTMQLKNAADTDRLVLVSHSGADDVDGGYIKGSEVSAFAWGGQAPGRVGGIERVMVGMSPGVIRTAPHGRAAAVDITENGEWAIDIVRTPLDAVAADVELTHTLSLPEGEGTHTDFQWSPDGRYLWVLGNSPHALWRYEPSEDLSSWPAPERITDLPGPSMKFAIDPVRSRLFVYCSAGGVEGQLAKLILFDARGTELGRHEADLLGTNGIAVSADGTLGMWTALMDDDVRLFSLGGNGVSPIGSPVETGSPFEPHFHPAKNSHSALVSSWDNSSVTPLSASETAVTAGATVTGLPLAAEMDRIERGNQIGVFLVPVVSSPASIRAVRLNVDGTAEKLDASMTLGSGYGATASGIGIQR